MYVYLTATKMCPQKIDVVNRAINKTVKYINYEMIKQFIWKNWLLEWI